jgi:hypothetical protein
MSHQLDTSVYPDLEDVPDNLETDESRADYMARICGAWDYGIIPTEETFALFAGWQDIFDRFPLRHSPAYAAFRQAYGWAARPVTILEAPWERRDRQAGRPYPDPCAQLV